MTAATKDAVGGAGLRRTLGFTDLLLLTLGTVIGSGIFIVPGVVLKQTQGHLGAASRVDRRRRFRFSGRSRTPSSAR